MREEVYNINVGIVHYEKTINGEKVNPLTDEDTHVQVIMKEDFIDVSTVRVYPVKDKVCKITI